MKKIITFLIFILTMLFLFVGCDLFDTTKTNDSSEKTGQVFTIYQNTFYAPKQLTQIQVTPVIGGETLYADFVCNDQQEVKVEVNIPESGLYKIVVFSSDGQSIWWNSIALELYGETYIYIQCSGKPIEYHGTCGGIPEDGTDMVE